MDMEKAEQSLQAELDLKRAQLSNIKEKLRKAECNKQQRDKLSAANALVRSNTQTQDPIWVDGLYYPAQYLVRQTRSMSTGEKQTRKKFFPSVCAPILSISDFQLPEDTFKDLITSKLANRRTIIKAVDVLDDGEKELTLKSSLFITSKVRDTTLLYGCHGNQAMVGIVHRNWLAMVNVGDDQLMVVRREPLPQDCYFKCTKILQSCSVCLIVGAVMSTTNQIMRVYVSVPECATVTLPDHSDRSGQSDVSELCVWSKGMDCVCVAALHDNRSVFIWSLLLDKCNKWSARLVTQDTPIFTQRTTSLVHVQGTDYNVASVGEQAIDVWNSFSGHIKHHYPLVCASHRVPQHQTPCILWAKQEVGTLFFVLCTPMGRSWLLAANDCNQVLQLHTFHTESPWHSMKCTPENNFQVVTQSCQLLVWDVAGCKLNHNICISGCEASMCVWSNTKQNLIVLTRTGQLHLLSD